MHYRLPILSAAALLALLTLAAPSVAHAYIDPGAGSVLLQVILAAIFGSLLFFKIMWQRFRCAIARIFSRSKSEE
jgi:hypothetical protein